MKYRHILAIVSFSGLLMGFLVAWMIHTTRAMTAAEEEGWFEVSPPGVCTATVTALERAEAITAVQAAKARKECRDNPFRIRQHKDLRQ